MDHIGTIRTDLVDIITPSRRGAALYKRILEQAASDPKKWARHHFIVIFDTDTDHERLKLEHWLAHTREILALPRVTALTATPEIRRNPNALRQRALEHGQNPFIYFQDDDDELLLNLEYFLQHAESHPETHAIYGVTETVNSKHHLIERFPSVHNDMFEFDVAEAARWFPTYAHPIAGLFRRKLLTQIPIFKAGDPAFCTGAAIFSLRLHAQGVPLVFLPQVIRQTMLHEDNDSGILTDTHRQEIVQDITDWLPELNDEEVIAFHQDILDALSKGWITTYREIAAMIETQLGY